LEVDRWLNPTKLKSRASFLEILKFIPYGEDYTLGDLKIMLTQLARYGSDFFTCHSEDVARPAVEWLWKTKAKSRDGFRMIL
jgi:hypothetical protein